VRSETQKTGYIDELEDADEETTLEELSAEALVDAADADASGLADGVPAQPTIDAVRTKAAARAERVKVLRIVGFLMKDLIKGLGREKRFP